MKSGSDISMKPDADMVMRKLAQNPSFCCKFKIEVQFSGKDKI